MDSIDGAMGARDGARAGAEAQELFTWLSALPDVTPSDDLFVVVDQLRAAVKALSDYESSVRIIEWQVETLSTARPATDLRLLYYRNAKALALKSVGRLEEARDEFKSLLALHEAQADEDDEFLQTLRLNYSGVLLQMGHVDRARDLARLGVGVFERILPPDDDKLQRARTALSAAELELGNDMASRALLEQVLEVRLRTLPSDHPDVLWAEGNLANTLRQLCDFPRALQLEEHVLQVRTAKLPDDHPDLQIARGNLAATLAKSGHFQRAQELLESALEACRLHLPDDHPTALKARENLGCLLSERGDYERACELLESVVADYSVGLPPDSPTLHIARCSLGVALERMGDKAGGQALLESAIASLEAVLPASAPELIQAQLDLAWVVQLQDSELALDLRQRAYDAARAAWPPLHQAVLNSRYVLGNSLLNAHRLDEAVAHYRAYRDDVLAGGEAVSKRTLDLVDQNLALALARRGDLEEALPIQRAMVEQVASELPASDPRAFLARSNLAWTLAAMGRRVEAEAEFDRLVDSLTARLSGYRPASVREAHEVARGARQNVHALLALLDLDGTTQGGSVQGVFEVIEELRRFAVEPLHGRALDATDSETVALQAELTAARERVEYLVERVDRGEPFGDPFVEATRERDALEARLRKQQASDSTTLPVPLKAAAISAALGQDEALVSYWTYPSLSIDPATGRRTVEEGRLLALVIDHDDRLELVRLGAKSEFDDAYAEWRDELLGDEAGVRGGSLTSTSPGATERALEAGRRLRRLLLDPIRDALPPVTTLWVCLDAGLHLVPLDGLPEDDSHFVGESVAIRRVFHAGVLLPAKFESQPPAEPSLLAVGGVSFAVADSHSAEVAGDRPHEAPGRFTALPQSLVEVESLGQAFCEHFGLDPVVLTGSNASVSAFQSLAPAASFLHLATHAWFEEPGSRLAAAVDQTASPGVIGVQAHIKSLAPFALCGLALAGADDTEVGTLAGPGLLTGEEIVALDLSRCSLAVLSACETHVGEVASGLSLASLQGAFHAAGAGASISSLWSVPDADSQRLMKEFYREFWTGNVSASVALWDAKMKLRDGGAAWKDWTVWVLTEGRRS